MANKRGRADTGAKQGIYLKRRKLNSADDITRLCDICTTMFDSSNDLQSLMTPLGFRHSSKGELFANARKGCPICFWIHSLLCSMWITSSGQVYFRAINSTRSSVPGFSRPNRLVVTIAELLDQPVDFPEILFSISSTYRLLMLALKLSLK